MIGDWLSRDASSVRYAVGTTFQIGKIGMLANTGTYIDAPFHRFERGKDIAAYPLEAVADVPGIVIRATERGGRALDAPLFRVRVEPLCTGQARALLVEAVTNYMRGGDTTSLSPKRRRRRSNRSTTKKRPPAARPRRRAVS